ETAEIARSEEEFWAEQIRPAMAQAWEKTQDGGRLGVEFLRRQPPAFQRRLVRAAGEALGLNLEFRHVEEVLALTKERGQAALSGNWIATLQDEDIQFRPGAVDVKNYAYPLLVPGAVTIGEAGVVIEARVAESGEVANDSAALVSPDAARGLVVRNWRPGDR